MSTGGGVEETAAKGSILAGVAHLLERQRSKKTPTGGAVWPEMQSFKMGVWVSVGRMGVTEKRLGTRVLVVLTVVSERYILPGSPHNICVYIRVCTP